MKIARASLALLLGAAAVDAAGAQQRSFPLARMGRTAYAIVVRTGAADAERFAASELATYLERMSGARFPVAEAGTERARGRRIVLRVDPPAAGARPASWAAAVARDDSYRILVRLDTLVLAGGSSRGVLFAVYDLLARLGCEWLAPELPMYGGHAEVVPRKERLIYRYAGDVRERPAFAIRKLDVAQGATHDEESLKRVVAWMPKARYNTLHVPLRFGGSGRVTWDRWRAALTPELEQRGLILEVGSHGIQNFLAADMEDGALFARHPEWFGRDSSCAPSRARRHMFDTENAGAVAFLTDSIVRYARGHPEVDMLDVWPPDLARWADCPEDRALGTPPDRQARLVNHVAAALRAVRPDLRLETIAYDSTMPPPRVPLDSAVFLDFCPINQSFDAAIDDPTAPNNAMYARAIRDWRRTFRGDIGLYSYYRKYAWRSLPIVIPRYMQRDLRWYASVPLQGISTYAEPGDWGTYELNHYTLGTLAWNPATNVRALVQRYARARYGSASRAATRALEVLEDDYRPHASIPFSRPKSHALTAAAATRLERVATSLAALRIGDPATAAAVRRLSLMLELARRDLAIASAKAKGAPPDTIPPMVEEVLAFLAANREQGVFMVRDGDRARYMRLFGVRTSD